VELPPAGKQLVAGKTFGSVESVKAVSDIYAPVSGEVIEANAALQNKPEFINTDPHGEGWLVKAKLANPAELNSLMDAAAYEAYIAEKQKEASA
jgi:glycine cleavage system H protein